MYNNDVMLVVQFDENVVVIDVQQKKSDGNNHGAKVYVTNVNSPNLLLQFIDENDHEGFLQCFLCRANSRD